MMLGLGGSAAGARKILWYIAKRILTLLVVLLLIASIDFATFRAFSDGYPIRTGDHEFYERVVSEYHLNSSKTEQYMWYMLNTMTLDFGMSASYQKGVDISDLAWPALERSLWMFAVAGVLTILAGIAFEAVASSIKTKIPRMLMRLVALGFLSIPSMGLVLLEMDMIVRLDLPIPFRASPYNPQLFGGEGTWDHLYYNISHGFLPVSACILLTFGFVSLFYRRQAWDGVSPRNVWRGAVDILKAMMSDRWPTKFYFAWIVSCLLAVDPVFNYHGLGTLLWNSLSSRDMPLTMTVFLFIAVVLAISNCAFDIIATVALRKNDITPARSYPEREDPTVLASHRGAPSIVSSAKGVWSDYRRSKAGLVALIVFITIVLVAAAAPLIATVRDPSSPANYEPSDPSNHWLNPLPPSLDPSPYTGYRHLLGTDHTGLDIYSAMLYGSRLSVVSCVIIGALSFFLGLLSGLVGAILPSREGILLKALGWLAGVIGEAFVAIPLFLVFIGPIIDPGLDNWAVSTLVAPVIFLWASVFVAHQVRQRARFSSAAGREAKESISGSIPTILTRALYVTKLSVTIGLLTVFAMEFYGLLFASRISWGALLEGAYERNAFASGTWWWYLSPLVGICTLVMSSFVMIDTLERVVRKRENAAGIAATQPSEVTIARSLA